MSDYEVDEWFSHPRTIRMVRLIRDRMDEIALCMVRGASTVGVEEMRLLAGKYQGLEQAMSLLQHERRKPE